MRKFIVFSMIMLLASSLAFAKGNEPEHGPTIIVPQAEIGGREVGDDCTDPIVISIPGDLPYTDAGQTTCGRGNSYEDTDLGIYDGGEDIIYRLDVTADIFIDIALDPYETTWTGIGLFDDCPDVGIGLFIDTGSSGIRTLLGVELLAGNSYYIMADTWPSPPCIDVFDLTITEGEAPPPPPENNTCETAEAVEEVVDYAFDTTQATTSGFDTHSINQDLWYVYTAPAYGFMNVDLCGSTFDTKLAIYGECDVATELGYNDDSAYCNGRSLQSAILDVEVFAGEDYYIQVGGYGSNSGAGDLTIEFMPFTDAPALFFSEYIEGSNNNKALEIYNASGIEVDLTEFVILGNYNGNPWSEAYTFEEGTMLAADDVYVIANDQAWEEILDVADVTLAYGDPWYTTAFNGDDVRALAYVDGADTTIVDIIGAYDLVDPGDGWEVAGIADATAEHTLVRKPEITEGNTDWAASAGTNEDDSEWIVLPQNTFDYLGSHPNYIEDLWPPAFPDYSLIGENNVRLAWNAPTPIEDGWLFYHDGTFEGGLASANGGAGIAQMFQPATYPCTIEEIEFWIIQDDLDQDIEVWILADDGATVLGGPYTQAVDVEWNTIDITDVEILSGGFMIATYNVLPSGPYVGRDTDTYNGTLYFGNHTDGFTELGLYGEAYESMGSHGAYVVYGGERAAEPQKLMPVSNDVRYHTDELSLDYSISNNAVRHTRDLLGYNVYRDDVMLNTELVTTLYYYDLDLDYGTYTYTVTAVYDGGVSDPSLPVVVDIVAVPAFDIPFTEGFDSGDFDTNLWVMDPILGTHWSVNTTTGNPAPSARFNWFSGTDYSETLTSHYVDCSALTEVELRFDISLNNYSSATLEQMALEVWDGDAWYQVALFDNVDDSFGFLNEAVDITDYAAGNIIKVRVDAFGEDAYNINFWYVDNIYVGEPILMGSLSGTVTDFETDLPIEGAMVVAGDYNTTTFGDGTYLIENMLSGTYNVYCSATDYEPAGPVEVTIVEGENSIVDFALLPAAPDAPEDLFVDPYTWLFTWAPPGGSIIKDDFDSYIVDSYLALQSPLWTTWSNAPGTGEDAMVSDDYALSGTQSVMVEGANDLVLIMDNYTVGAYTMELSMYIPDGHSGYFNLQKTNTPGEEWAFQIVFETDGVATADAGAAAAAVFDYNHDEWMDLEIVVDLDNDWAEFWFNGDMMVEYQWTLGTFGTPGLLSLGGMNIFASGGDPLAYFDDIDFKPYSAARELTGYNVFLDDAPLASDITDLQYQFADLTSGDTYTAGVQAVYDDGLSNIAEYVFTALSAPIIPPSNLAYEVQNYNNVHLTWEAPSGTGEWIRWDSGDNFNAIGLTGDTPQTFWVASQWDPEDLTAYDGATIERIEFFPNDEADFTLYIWTGPDADLAYTQVVEIYTVEEFNEVTLDEPFTIDASTNLWFGYETTHDPGLHPAGTDPGPAIAGYGDMVSFDGSAWEPLSNYLDYNWNLAAFVVGGGREPVVLSKSTKLNKPVINNVRSPQLEKLSLKASQDITFNLAEEEDERIFLGYNIYRDGDEIDFVAQGTLEYLDAGLDAGVYEYQVTALYDNGESEPTDAVEVTIVLPAPTNFNATSMAPATSNVMCTWTAPALSRDRNLTGYKIYRDDVEVGTATGTFFMDLNVPTGVYLYHATAVYDNEYESLPSNQDEVDHVDANNTAIPLVTELTGNYPNPFNPITRINFALCEQSEVNIEIYNIKGEKVTTLVNELMDAGYYSLTWNSTDQYQKKVSSGVYFYKMRAGNYTSTKKMILMK
ncbi:MAG: hypothetical protein APR54_02240 [Candidatus Cloacimonas sp. SDB]|nr:MAG: hypothetical protein APR54_02240 [Candidatus Cloacimonas sp. SDB]